MTTQLIIQALRALDLKEILTGLALAACFILLLVTAWSVEIAAIGGTA